jgi:hypothetical protein
VDIEALFPGRFSSLLTTTRTEKSARLASKLL